MQKLKRWLLLLGLPLLAALVATLVDSALIRLAQQPLINEQRQRIELLEDRLASHDLTQMDDAYLAALKSEKMTAQHEIETWRNDHRTLIQLDRIQLLPSIVFWVAYFMILGKMSRKETSE